MNKLQIVETSPPKSEIFPIKEDQMTLIALQAQAKFEKEWKERPEQFSPSATVLEQDRMEKTWALLDTEMRQNGGWKGKNVADLGCGEGEIALRAARQGASVTACDVATLALKEVEKRKGAMPIQLVHGALPQTNLPDAAFDLVLCLDVIAHIPQKGHRLLCSELSRLLAPCGTAVLSTRLDIHTFNPFEHLLYLAQTEFKIEKILLSHHYLFVRMLQFLNQFQKRKKRSARPLIKNIHHFLDLPFKPFRKSWLKSNRWMELLEKICEETWQEEAATHAIILGNRKPLF